jgi:hypothetical protein
MARLIFTQKLARFIEVSEVQTEARSLCAALESAFECAPRLRGDVLDEQGHVRDNVLVFVDGRRSAERPVLADALRPDSTVYILQALSGG